MIEVFILENFLHTVDTVPDGLGFALFDATHLIWLGIFLAVTVANCIWYRKLSPKGKGIWKKVMALLIVADELFKMAMLTIGGRYTFSYLPLHLCSINIFLIAIHAWKPAKTLSGFLYTVCIPGAIAALLFPTWTELPVLNFMHLHSFTVHILLAMYPIVLGTAGELAPTWKQLHKYLGLLVVMAIPIYIVNLLLDTNFMFLMSADPGNPLYIFEQLWGSHLLGFPVIIGAILIVMYIPMELWRHLRAKKAAKELV